MELLLELINTFVYFLCVISIGELFLNYRRKELKYEKGMLFAIACVSVIALIYFDAVLKIMVHIVSITAVGKVWFKESWKSILGLYFGSAAVLSMLSKLFDVISTEIISLLKIVEADNIVRIISLCFILLVIQVIGKYYKDKYEIGIKNIGAKYWLLFIIIMFFDSFVTIILGEFILDTLQVERRLIVVFSYWCVVIGLLIQLVLLINMLVTRNVHKENEKLAKQFLESQNEHYQYLEKREYETKKFRHDIKNHLLLLENLINTGKYEDAEEYLSNINEKVSSFNNQISVNNGIADAILNRFYTEAKEIGITLKVSGHFPLECYITAYDICTVFSNLLSNAIRAESEAEGKIVEVHIKYIENKVLLTVENDYVNELNEVDGIFKTTKEDSLGHGYGLSNVRECVEKNGGYLSISTDNQHFKVMIMMMNENEEML
ncbi:MAG: GHKL domain-containing protein [Agathobacter sp.]|nr:GHKL domain-containing protein [Agathobacter sp.]